MYLPLGSHPPANAFLRKDQLGGGEPSFDLDTYVCLGCGLVQIPDNVPPGFFEQYLYVPSSSETMKSHFAGLASIVQDHFLREGGLLVDIGCNDGLFLEAAHRRGIQTLGIDPAANLAEFARQKGLKVVTEYFDPQTADRVMPVLLLVPLQTRPGHRPIAERHGLGGRGVAAGPARTSLGAEPWCAAFT